VRLLAYRDAARARREHQLDPAALADTGAGRRGVRSSAGGRLRLREPQRGRKTKKGRQRSTGAWREPKGLSVDGVDAEGKRAASLTPGMDATRQGPEVGFALRRTSLPRLQSPQAAQGLSSAEGAPWLWKRVPRLGPALGLTTAQG